jgi:hypothetical protein
VAHTCGVSQPWISRLVVHYRADGEAGLDGGPHTLAWQLEREHASGSRRPSAAPRPDGVRGCRGECAHRLTGRDRYSAAVHGKRCGDSRTSAQTAGARRDEPGPSHGSERIRRRPPRVRDQTEGPAPPRTASPGTAGPRNRGPPHLQTSPRWHDVRVSEATRAIDNCLPAPGCARSSARPRARSGPGRADHGWSAQSTISTSKGPWKISTKRHGPSAVA